MSTINAEILNENFNLCVLGYNLVNSEPIKESVWESINTQIFIESGIQVETQSNGSHSPGSDITCSIGNISNKSAKYEMNTINSFSISSYRLTSICSADNCGDIEQIKEEIHKRKNFQYYSIIVREEQDTTFRYDWYLIPSEYPGFNPFSYTWIPVIGKRGKNKEKQVGWKTEDKINGCSMIIQFSMSSQLWIHVEVTEELSQFIIAKSPSYLKEKKYNYIQLYKFMQSV